VPRAGGGERARELGALLRGWAEGRRLAPERAAAVLRAVVAAEVTAGEVARPATVHPGGAALERVGLAAAAALATSLRSVDRALSRTAGRWPRAWGAQPTPQRLYVRLV
jgi:hypothetical protein